MLIEVSKLVKSYHHKVILNLEPFALESGYIYGLVGPNGIGKTTLLRILSGLERDHTGSVTYSGQRMNQEVMKKVTYLSQTPYMMRNSVWENIAYPLKIRKVAEQTIEEEVAAIMDEFGLRGLSDQLATSLSGGEAQKVALARALVFKPEVLLLDEPTASIDTETIETIEHAIQKRNKAHKMTAIVISHNREQIDRLCDHILTLSEGRLLSVENVRKQAIS